MYNNVLYDLKYDKTNPETIKNSRQDGFRSVQMEKTGKYNGKAS